mmetsp:Transcript_18145/g.53028  ORF Transcript_18145/g.53028 Transcript_18145/m.53028 type:complete len:423 (-) Transcript_18145:356-1624(-)
MLELVYHGVDLLAAFGQHLRSAIDSSVLLHDLLHLEAKTGRWDIALGIAEFVEVCDRGITRILGQRWHRCSRLGNLCDAICAGSPEDDNVQEGVGTESVGAVDRSASDLACSKESRDDGVVVLSAICVLLDPDDFAKVVRWDASHVVVDRGEHRNGLLRHVHSSKNVGSLGDSGEALSKEVGGEVIEVEEDVVIVLSDSPTLANLHGHGAGDHVPRGEVLGRRRVALHEPLPLRVPQDTTLSAASLGYEAPSAVDARGVELHELRIFVGQASTHGHGIPVSGAGMRRGAGEVCPTVATGGQDGVGCVDSVQTTVFHAHGQHANTPALVVHDEIQGKVLNEVRRVEGQGPAIERVQHGVARAVRSSRATVRLATLAKVQGLASEGALVDLALLGARKGHPEGLELEDSFGSLAAHVVDGVLIT